MNRGRVLRECAVDLIRASDLLEGSREAQLSAETRLYRVIADLEAERANLSKRLHAATTVIPLASRSAA